MQQISRGPAPQNSNQNSRERKEGQPLDEWKFVCNWLLAPSASSLKFLSYPLCLLLLALFDPGKSGPSSELGISDIANLGRDGQLCALFSNNIAYWIERMIQRVPDSVLLAQSFQALRSLRDAA